MRVVRVVAVLGFAVGMLAGTSPAVGTPVTGTQVPVSAFRDLEFDPTTDRLFVSDGDAVRVFAEDGTPIATIPGMFGAGGIAVSGADVFVALTTVGKIARIAAATASVAQTYTIGQTIGDSVAVDGGLVWFTHAGSPWEGVGSLDIATGTVVANRISRAYSPLLRTSPSRPGELYIGERGLSPADVQRWDVSVATPVQLARTGHGDVGSNLGDYALAPDGSVLYLSTGSPYQYPEVDATSLVPNGVIYPGVPYPNAVAVGTELVAFGSMAYYADDVRVYRRGEPVALQSFGFGSTLAARGLALADDDSMLYAVVDGQLWFQSLVPPPPIPSACVGTQLTFTGTDGTDDLSLGQPAACPAAAQVQASLLGGSDRFALTGSTYPDLASLVVDLGPGADAVAGTDDLVHQGAVPVTIAGGTGVDTLECCAGTDAEFATMVVARGNGFWLTDFWSLDAPVRVDGVETLTATTTGPQDTYTNPIVGTAQVLNGSGGALLIDSRGLPITASTSTSVTFGGRGRITWGGFGNGGVFVYDGRLVDYIDGIYLRLLGRDADSDGLGYWYDLFSVGTPRANLTAAIIHSPESAYLRVQELYAAVLRRAPDRGGWTYWANQIVAGSDVGNLRPLLYASNEYFQSAGRGTDGGFVDALYRDILHRAPDAGGRSFWIGRLAAGVSRIQVVASILGLSEPREALVDDLHVAVLGRHASAGERSAWVPTLVQQGEFVVLGALLASNEFYDLVAPLDLALVGASSAGGAAAATTQPARPQAAPLPFPR